MAHLISEIFEKRDITLCKDHYIAAKSMSGGLGIKLSAISMPRWETYLAKYP